MPHRNSSHLNAFTLIELSIVVLILALLAAAAMRYVNSQSDSVNLAATNATLDAVDAAIFNFMNENGRLPCPADITQAENTSVFGTETDTLGDGLCTGYNYINSGIDPDAATGSDNNYAGLADPIYTTQNSGGNTTPSQVVEGAVPTKALRLPDRYAYDAWGNKIFYAVDKRMTASSAFTTYGVTNTAIGAIVIKKVATDTLANAITYSGNVSNAIYALVSTGKNGHGGFARNLTATSVRASAGSTNADELDNCHCDSNANPTTFNRIFVQKPKTNDSTSFTDNFDDITRFKLRSNISYSGDLK